MKRLIAFSAVALSLFPCFASDAPLTISRFTMSNGVKTVAFSNMAPAAEQYILMTSPNVAGAFTNDPGWVQSGPSLRTTNNQSSRFYRLGAAQMSSNALMTAHLLNRLAYGPTPDELVRVAGIGPQTFINEQLAPELQAETSDTYTTEITNGVPVDPTPQWRFASFSGFFTESNLYLYLTAPGDAYIDDISLTPYVTIITTNIDPGVSTNYVTNVVQQPEAIVGGDFEDSRFLTNGTGLSTNRGQWIKTPNMIGSALNTTYAHSGTQSLHLVAAQLGSGLSDSIYYRATNLMFNYFPAGNVRAVLSFWYLATPTSSDIKLRLSGSGIGGSGNNSPPQPEWVYATATGTASNGATRAFYIYLDGGAGEAYIDDIKLVPGFVPGVGPNLIRNADFEAPLGTNNWNPIANFAGSFISSNYSHSGAGSLKIVGTGDGTGNGNAIFQTNTFITNGQTYTVSFWYLPPTRGRTLTVRLTGADPGNPVLQIYEPGGSAGSIRRRLDAIGTPSFETGDETKDTLGGGILADLRALHVLNAISAKRQLIQVLLQFFENHFVTQHAKSVDYFDRFYDDGTLMDTFATDWEYRERSKWEAALLNPNCNFYDLLRIHAESPAEIVYLDSVDSKGNGANVANENYAREILELFCMGVDNGYDQQDIIVLSRAWTGWSVEIVDPENINNPFAPQTTRIGFYPGNGSAASSAISNLVGVWTFNFKRDNHGTNRAPIFSAWDPNGPVTSPRPLGGGNYPYAGGQSKVVPARFGSPWAGTPYRLVIPPGRVSGITNGLADGYDVIAHLANLPFTMEYLSVKLCRLFVHDDFPNPTTKVGTPEYDFYDYTNPNRSAEAELVRQCMVAWDTPVNGRKGNIRSVLNVIFNSELFRTHSGVSQKVKTPVEFAAGTIRSIRSTTTSGALTATTDGYSISGRSRTASSSPMTRMGSMMLFDRDAPDGYPEAGAPWISSGTLAERIRFVQTTLMAASDTNKADNISGGNFNITDPVGLLKAKLVSGSWNNAGAVADLFLGYLFPAEGKANLDEYRTLAINFLNSPDAGGAPTPTGFSSLGNTTPAYDTRVRAMVSMLMTLPRFQEQ